MAAGAGMFSNNAPPPIPGGFGNPTGVNSGAIANKGGSTAFPSFPVFGPINFGPNSGPYSSNSGGAAAGQFTGSGNTGFGLALPGSKDDKLGPQLVQAFGEGGGGEILHLLQKGLFNPKVAQAMLAQMQPGVNRGQADILNAFGEGGNRFSSSAALGLGDFNSQVQLNQGSILAQMFQHAQDQELNLFESILPTLHAEKANKGGLFGKILGGLEIAGGLIGAPFTGGASLGLVGSGIGQLTGGGGGGGGSSSGGGGLDMNALKSLFSGSSSTSMPDMSTLAAPQGSMDSVIQQLINSQQQSQLGQSGANAFGGGGGSNQNFNEIPFL